LGIGAGHENAAIGAQALYYFQFPDDRWRVAPHVGVGYLGATGFAGGAMGSFGHRHRLVLDLVAGPMAATGGSEVATHLYYGVAALLGYEWMAASGLALRSTIGVAYRPTLAASERIYLAINVISINYKLW
jgi:hypothetical protein